MAVQYETLNEFKAYTTRISEYIAKESLVNIPGLVSTGPNSNNPSQQAEFLDFVSQSGVSHLQWYHKTIANGKVKKHRKSNEPLIVFNDEKSSNLEDLNVLEYIAYKLAGVEPELGLAVGLFGLPNPNIQDGSQNNFQDATVETATQNWGYVPYVYIKASFNYIMLAPQQIPSIVASNSNYFDADSFISTMTEQGFIFQLDSEYDLSDNFSQFLPVGTKKRYVSKQALRNFSDTTITELQPDTIRIKIDKFFDSWNKVKEFIPIGYQATTGQNFIANPSFGGGIGPGVLTRNTDLTDRAAFQEVVTRENPGFSDYVLKQDGYQDSFYSINLSAGPDFSYGAATTYVASCWVYADPTYQGVDEALFDIQMEQPNEQTGQNSIYNAPQIINDITGEIIIGGLWADNQGNVWRQYKKVFTTPSVFSEEGKIIWSLGKSYAATGDTQLYDASNSNPNAFRYITGLRIETGTEVQNLERLQLTAINEQSIARVAKDCQSLLNPYDVPLFSFNDFDDFVEGQKVSSQIADLYVDIKDGLLESLESITDSSSTAFNNLSLQLQAAGEISGDAAVNISSAFTEAAGQVSIKVNELTSQILGLKNSFINNININGGSGGSGNQEQSQGQAANGTYAYTSYLTNPSPANNIQFSKNMYTSWNGGYPLAVGYESNFGISDNFNRNPQERLNQIDGNYEILQSNQNLCFTSRPLQTYTTQQPLPVKEFNRIVARGNQQQGISTVGIHNGTTAIHPILNNVFDGTTITPQQPPFNSTLSPIGGDALFHALYGNSVNDYVSQKIIPITAESFNQNSYIFTPATWNYFHGNAGWASKTLFENGIMTANSGGGLENNGIATEQGNGASLIPNTKAYADLVFKKWNALRAARGLGTEVLDKGHTYLPYLGPDGYLAPSNTETYNDTSYPYVTDSSVIVTTHAYKPGEYMDIKVSLTPNGNFPNPSYTDKLGVSRDLIESYNIFLSGVDKRNYVTKNDTNTAFGFKFWRKTLFCYNAYHNGESILNNELNIRTGFEVEDFYPEGTLNNNYQGGQDGGGNLFTNMCPLIPGSYVKAANGDFNYLNQGGIRLLPKHLRQNVLQNDGGNGGSVNGEGLENNKHTFLPFSQYHLQPMYGGLCGVPILRTVRTQDLTQAEINAGETAYRIFRLRVQADIPTDHPVMFETRAEGASDASPGIYNDYFGYSATTPYIKYTQEGNTNLTYRERANIYDIRYMPSTKNPIWNILSRQWLGVSNFGVDTDNLYGDSDNPHIYEEGYLQLAGGGMSSMWNNYGGFQNERQNSLPLEQSTFKIKYFGANPNDVQDLKGQCGGAANSTAGGDYSGGFEMTAQRAYWNSIIQGAPNTSNNPDNVNLLLEAYTQYSADNYPNGESPFFDNGAALQLSYDQTFMDEIGDVYDPYNANNNITLHSGDDFGFAMNMIFASTPVFCDFDQSFERPLILAENNYPTLTIDEFLLNESFEGHANFNTGFVFRNNRFSTGDFLSAGQEYDYGQLDGSHILSVDEHPSELIVNCEFSIVPMLPCQQGSDIDWIGYTPFGKPIKGDEVYGSWTGVDYTSGLQESTTNGLPDIVSFKTSVQYSGAPFSDEHFQDIGVADRFGNISSPFYDWTSWPFHNNLGNSTTGAGRNRFLDLRTVVPGTGWIYNALLDSDIGGAVYQGANPIRFDGHGQFNTGDSPHDIVAAGAVGGFSKPQSAKTTPLSNGSLGASRQNGATCHRAGELAVLSTFNILQSQAVPGYHTIPPNLDFVNGMGGAYVGSNTFISNATMFDDDFQTNLQGDNYLGDFGDLLVSNNYPAPYGTWKLTYDLERAVSFGVLCDLYPFDPIGGEMTPMYRRIHNQVLWRYNWYGCGLIAPFWRYKSNFVVDDEHYNSSGLQGSIDGLIEYGQEGQGGGTGGGTGGGAGGQGQQSSNTAPNNQMWGWSKESDADGNSPYDQAAQ